MVLIYFGGSVGRVLDFGRLRRTFALSPGRTPSRSLQLAVPSGGGGWNRRKPPTNGARQMARYGRQAMRGQLKKENGLVT